MLLSNILTSFQNTSSYDKLSNYKYLLIGLLVDLLICWLLKVCDGVPEEENARMRVSVSALLLPQAPCPAPFGTELIKATRKQPRLVQSSFEGSVFAQTVLVSLVMMDEMPAYHTAGRRARCSPCSLLDPDEQRCQGMWHSLPLALAPTRLARTHPAGGNPCLPSSDSLPWLPPS